MELDYENLPDFYTNRKVIGNFLEICKKVNIEEEYLQEKEHVDRRRKGTEPMKAVVQTKDGRLEQGKHTEANNKVNREKNRETEKVIDVDQSTDSNIKQQIAENTFSTSTVVSKKGETSGTKKFKFMEQLNRFKLLRGLLALGGDDL